MVSIAFMEPQVDLSFGEWLTVRRKRVDLTQNALSELLGVSPQTIRNWESGRSQPFLSINQWRAICKALDCQFDDIPGD